MLIGFFKFPQSCPNSSSTLIPKTPSKQSPAVRVVRHKLRSQFHKDENLKAPLPTMKQSTAFLSAFLALVSPAGAQLSHRDSPEIQWEVQIKSVRQGNGVFLSPNEEMLVASTNLGYVSAFGARDGAEVFHYTYVPDTTAIEFISSTSGIAFSTDYMVYSVIVNKDSISPLTRVVALSMDGQQRWVSPSLKGISPGTPVVSEDGAYVFLTHNSIDETVGHLTVLDGATGEIFFTQINDSAPFAPLGIFHGPAEGYYDGGENNRNDIIVWSVQPKPTDTSVGPGQTFAFQFPIGFSGSSAGLAYTQLGTQVKDFQAIQKPTFADDGRTLYWGTTRSQFRCWLGQESLDRYRFSRERTATIGFSRGIPAMQAVFAAPALSKDPANRFVFGGSAAKEFVKMSTDFADEIMVPTGELVKSSARVSPDDAYVYYLETNGILHQASTMDLSDKWVLDVGATTEGEFALNSNGTILYVGDASGFIQAIRVGDVPTEAPSAGPSSLPTMALSASPTAIATAAPTKTPTRLSTPPPTISPVTNPTATAQPNVDKQNAPTTSSASCHMGSIIFLFAFLPLFGL